MFGRRVFCGVGIFEDVVVGKFFCVGVLLVMCNFNYVNVSVRYGVFDGVFMLVMGLRCKVNGAIRNNLFAVSTSRSRIESIMM